MSSDYEKESKALTEAVHGREVNYTDISANLTYTKGETPSANHKMGSNPAWWLDCQRRGDRPTVVKGLDWCEWYAQQPLHENESMTCSAAYRVRIDQGTYALAMFADFEHEVALRDALLRKCRLSVGMALLSAFTGSARKALNENPQPPDVARLMVCDGPIDPLPGDSQDEVPYIAAAGMRSWVRTGSHYNGEFMGLNDHHLRVLVAQALSLPYRKSYAVHQSDIFDTIRSRAFLPPWGLSTIDVQDALSFLGNKADLNLAATIHSWLLDAPLPKLPYKIVQRGTGAIEVAQLRSQDSSTGAKQVEVVAADGTRYIGSADNGMRGGANSSRNIQPQEAVEFSDHWLCRWLSGQGETVSVPRPAGTVVWTVDVANGNSTLHSGSGDPVTPPNPNPDPGPTPTPPGQSPLIYLGTTAVPGEHLYGSHSPTTTIREIHGDPASGFPKRWIAE